MGREGVLAKAKVPWEGGRWCSKTNMGEQGGGGGGVKTREFLANVLFECLLN